MSWHHACAEADDKYLYQIVSNWHKNQVDQSTTTDLQLRHHVPICSFKLWWKEWAILIKETVSLA